VSVALGSPGATQGAAVVQNWTDLIGAALLGAYTGTCCRTFVGEGLAFGEAVGCGLFWPVVVDVVAP
jgi:hypothetical protein